MSELESRTEDFGKWLVIQQGLSVTTANTYKWSIKAALRTIGILGPKKEDVEQYRDYMIEAGKTRSYVRNICKAFKWYGLYINGDLNVKLPVPNRRKLPEYLTEQEVQEILYATDNIRDYAVLSTLAYSGLRCLELCNLNIEDVDIENRVIRVCNGKGGKSAEIPVSDRCIDAIKQYMEHRPRADDGHSDALFLTIYGKRITTRRIRTLVKKYARKAHIKKDVHPHMFRHALATNLLRQGCPLPFVQRQLRHSRIETTMIYLHIDNGMLKDAYDKFVPKY